MNQKSSIMVKGINIINNQGNVSLNTKGSITFINHKINNLAPPLDISIKNIIVDNVNLNLEIHKFRFDNESSLLNVGGIFLLGEGSLSLNVDIHESSNKVHKMPSAILYVEGSNEDRKIYGISASSVYAKIYGFIIDDATRKNQNAWNSLDKKYDYPTELLNEIESFNDSAFYLKNGLCLSAYEFHNYILKNKPKDNKVLKEMYADTIIDIESFHKILVESSMDEDIINNAMRDIKKIANYILNKINEYESFTDQNEIRAIDINDLNISHKEILKNKINYNDIEVINFKKIEIPKSQRGTDTVNFGVRETPLSNKINEPEIKVSLWKKLFGSSENYSNQQSLEESTRSVNEKDMDNPNKTTSTIKIIQEFRSYQLDLVKMMERPILADLFDEKVISFDKLCNYYELSGELSVTFEDFYREWSALKNYADMINRSKFNNEQQIKIKKADSLLAIALNEGSSDNEKEVSAKALLKQLEGVLPINKIIIDCFRDNVGLKQLES